MKLVEWNGGLLDQAIDNNDVFVLCEGSRLSDPRDNARHIIDCLTVDEHLLGGVNYLRVRYRDTDREMQTLPTSVIMYLTYVIIGKLVAEGWQLMEHPFDQVFMSDIAYHYGVDLYFQKQG